MPSKRIGSDTSAPYGYTKTGRIRKRPLKSQLLVPESPVPLSLEGICPVPTCAKNFQKRPDPKRALWQHLKYYTGVQVGDDEHREAHAAKKATIRQLAGKYKYKISI